MRLRVAVLASDVPGTDEIVSNGVTGLLAPPGDAAAFARQAAQLLADPAHRTELAQAAERAVADRFSVTRQADEHLALYEMVLAR
jgi:glycosyltransferase involved in cell wall biosynthesis